MYFRDALTVEERLAILGLIDTYRDLEDAKAQLRLAETLFHQSAKYLTYFAHPYCKTEDPKSVAIPEQFAVEVNGRCWLITVDIEGEHAHDIREIDAIGKL